MAPSLEQLNLSLPLAMTMISFIAIALYNAFEILVRACMTFKKYTGLYFWSIAIALFGVFVYSIAEIVYFYQLTPNRVISVTLVTIGWYPMVTGQSLVLYSRLHLLVSNERWLRIVLGVIILDAILFHIPTTVLTYGSNLSSEAHWKHAFNIMEKTQMTAFSLQELGISALYTYATSKAFKPRKMFDKKHVNRVLRHLIMVNILIIIMDLTLLSCEYANMYEIEGTMKAAVYSIKLRLEFPVLTQLTNLFSKENSLMISGDLCSGPTEARPSLGSQPSTTAIERAGPYTDVPSPKTLNEDRKTNFDPEDTRKYTGFTFESAHPISWESSAAKPGTHAVKS